MNRFIVSLSVCAALFAAQGIAAQPPSPSLGIDAPLGSLMADPDAWAVVVRDLPRIEAHPRLADLRELSLRTIVPNSRGWLTDDELRKVDADLHALGAGAAHRGGGAGARRVSPS